jgi:hypothetical protein
MVAKEKTDVVVQSQAGLPAEYAGLEAYAGQGLNDLDSSDRSVPFLKVLEKTSPEIESVPGARPGMIIDTATQKLYESIRFVPAVREHAFVEWVPIETGGGLVGSYTMDSDIAKWAKSQRGKIKLRNGNDLVETFYLFGVLLPEVGDDELDPKPVVLSFTSTRIKTYKSIVNRSDSIMLMGAGGRKFKAPWFCHVWRIGTVKKVDGAQSWFLYTAEFDSEDKGATGARLPAEHPAVLMGAEMVRQKSSGELKMAQESSGLDQPDTGASNSGGGRQQDLEDPPF